MEQQTHLLKEQLNRIEFLLMDIKQTSAITQRIVDNSIRAQKPVQKPQLPKPKGK